MRMMDFWILCAIMFIIVECRDKDFKKKNRSQKVQFKYAYVIYHPILRAALMHSVASQQG